MTFRLARGSARGDRSPFVRCPRGGRGHGFLAAVSPGGAVGLFPRVVEDAVMPVDVEVVPRAPVDGVVPCALVDEAVGPGAADEGGVATAVVGGPPLPGFVADGLTGAAFGVVVPTGATVDAGKDGLAAEVAGDDVRCVDVDAGPDDVATAVVAARPVPFALEALVRGAVSAVVVGTTCTATAVSPNAGARTGVGNNDRAPGKCTGGTHETPRKLRAIVVRYNNTTPATDLPTQTIMVRRAAPTATNTGRADASAGPRGDVFAKPTPSGVCWADACGSRIVHGLFSGWADAPRRSDPRSFAIRSVPSL
jgi:hypothetical protein